MKNMIVVAKWEFLTRVKSKLFLLSTILFPILIIGISVVPSLLMTKVDTENKLIGVLDSTGFLGGKIEVKLTEDYKLNNGEQKYQVMQFKSHEAELAASLLDSSVIDGYLIIPANVVDSNKVTYFSKTLGDFKGVAEVRSTANTVISRERMILENIDPDVVDKLNRRIDFITLEPGKTAEQSDELLSYFVPFIFVMMLFFTIFMTSQILLRSVLQERSNKLVETLLSSVSASELMSGKILGLGLLGLLQLAVYLVIGVGVSSYQGLDLISGVEVLFFIVYFIFGYLLYSAIFAAIGSIFDNEQEAQQATSVLSLITVVPIMLSSFVVANPNATMTVVLSYIPVMTPFFMILRIGVQMPSMVQIVTTTVVLVASVGVTMLIAGKIFRTAILLYGKRPTLPEIMR
ncbi:MAG: ABC transporter permease, partial [Candidatus Marinimicrobia bacterium]|nr:ABC transporter permease [Candidatus Neomarinimicrobiota bacterium]